MKKVRIINKKQFIKTSILLFSILLVITVLIANTAYSNSETNYKLAYVIKGETLWQIAQEEIEKNQYFEGKDIRDVIYEIKKVNHMITSNLSEGMQIKIPIY